MSRRSLGRLRMTAGRSIGLDHPGDGLAARLAGSAMGRWRGARRHGASPAGRSASTPRRTTTARLSVPRAVIVDAFDHRVAASIDETGRVALHEIHAAPAIRQVTGYHRDEHASPKRRAPEGSRPAAGRLRAPWAGPPASRPRYIECVIDNALVRLHGGAGRGMHRAAVCSGYVDHYNGCRDQVQFSGAHG